MDYKVFVRQSNIEWLRIISMLAIVAGHSVTHGGFVNIPATGNGLFSIVLTQGSRIGVDIFILISGFFGGGVFEIEDKAAVCTGLDLFHYDYLLSAQLGCCSPWDENSDFRLTSHFKFPILVFFLLFPADAGRTLATVRYFKHSEERVYITASHVWNSVVDYADTVYWESWIQQLWMVPVSVPAGSIYQEISSEVAG